MIWEIGERETIVETKAENQAVRDKKAVNQYVKAVTLNVDIRIKLLAVNQQERHRPENKRVIINEY